MANSVSTFKYCKTSAFVEVNFTLSNSRVIQRGGDFNVNGPSVYTGIFSKKL